MPNTPQKILAQAVRGRVVLKYYGELCRSLVGIALVPAVCALALGDLDFALPAGTAATGLAIAGWLLGRLKAANDLQTNEALLIVSTGYAFTALLMAWPLSTDGLTGMDAVFHSISAITTTGLSTVDELGSRSAAFLFTQAWMQWYGGLVIVVLAVFILGPGAAAKQLSASEGLDQDRISGTRTRAHRALLFYGALTFLGFLVLRLLGANFGEATLYALTAVSTGGFSMHDAGLRSLEGWPLRAAVLALCFAGAISFGRYQNLGRRLSARQPLARPLVSPEVLTLLVLCLLVSCLLAVNFALRLGFSWADALRNAPLLAVSAQTTAGFSPLTVADLDGGSKLLLILSMLIGGEIGSTAGGLKIFRFLLILRLVQLTLLQPALPPHAVVRPELDGRPLESDELENAIGIVALFGGVITASWLVFLFYGYRPIDALFEVVSATGTVGLSSGLARPDLEPLLKAVLCLDMWMGRLEVLAVLIVFHPRTWLGRRSQQ